MVGFTNCCSPPHTHIHTHTHTRTRTQPHTHTPHSTPIPPHHAHAYVGRSRLRCVHHAQSSVHPLLTFAVSAVPDWLPCPWSPPCLIGCHGRHCAGLVALALTVTAGVSATEQRSHPFRICHSLHFTGPKVTKKPQKNLLTRSRRSAGVAEPRGGLG